MLMTAADYRESLRGYSPKVFVNGDAVTASRTIRACAGHQRYRRDLRLRPCAPTSGDHDRRQGTSGKIVNRMAHIDETSTDLLYKLEAVRLVCKVSGCAQRYLTHDAMNGIFQATRRTDDAHGTDYSQRFLGLHAPRSG